MDESNGVRTPIALGKAMATQKKINKDIQYQEAIGSLLYVAIWMRPNISYATTYLSQFNTKFTKTHWQLVKRVLRCLKGTIDLKLTFKPNGEGLIGFADADWGGAEDGKSFSGFNFKIGNGSVSWEARNQRCVTLSSTKSEYVGVSAQSLQRTPGDQSHLLA